MALNAASGIVDRVFGRSSAEEAEQLEPQMLACTWQSRRRIEVRQVPRAKLVEDTDVVLRLTGLSIDEVDLQKYKKQDLKAGEILGGECIGVIEELGASVSGFAVGDRVVVASTLYCNECGDSCKTHPLSACQAEFVRVPLANMNILKLPAEITDEVALFLSSVMPTTLHAVREARVDDNQRVAVWGCSPIGLSLIQWCLKLYNNVKVTAVDTSSEKLDFAKNLFPEIELLNLSGTAVKSSAAKARRESSSPSTGVTESALQSAVVEDTVFDCILSCTCQRTHKSFINKFQKALLSSGAPEYQPNAYPANEMMKKLAPGGVLAIVEEVEVVTGHVRFDLMNEKSLTLIGGCGRTIVQKEWPQCVQYLADGTYDPTKILAKRYGFAQTPLVYEQQLTGVGKVFLETAASNPPTPGLPARGVLPETRNSPKATLVSSKSTIHSQGSAAKLANVLRRAQSTVQSTVNVRRKSGVPKTAPQSPPNDQNCMPDEDKQSDIAASHPAIQVAQPATPP